MPAKKVKKFCRLAKFLEQSDKDLYQAFDDLCLLGLFRVRGRGITFLYPADKAYRKKIIDHAYSNNPEKAVDMVKCLVLLDFLPSPSDFNSKKDDIPNSHHKKLEVESADAKEVKLKSGHKLVVDKTYIPLRSGEPIAVYQLTGKGELPTTGTSSSMKYNNESSGNKRGGYVQGGTPNNFNFNNSDIIKITEFVEDYYDSGASDDSHCIYRCILSLIYGYAITDKCDSNTRYDIYSKICASPRASFYIILAPWCLEKNYNIHTLIIESGLNEITLLSKPEISSILNKCKVENLYNNNLDTLISICRSENNISSASIAQNVINRNGYRDKLVSMINSPILSKTEIIKSYGNDTNRLYKDLITTFCYLCASYEIEDRTYYKINFTYRIKNVFNDINSFSDSVNQAAYNLSIFYSLLKSDAFLYTPLLSTERDLVMLDGNYKDFKNEVPEPNGKLFYTIQFSDLAIVGGGGCDSSTYFGGIVNSL